MWPSLRDREKMNEASARNAETLWDGITPDQPRRMRDILAEILALDAAEVVVSREDFEYIALFVSPADVNWSADTLWLDHGRLRITTAPRPTPKHAKVDVSDRQLWKRTPEAAESREGRGPAPG